MWLSTNNREISGRVNKMIIRLFVGYTQKKRKHKIMAPNRLPLTLLVLAHRIMLICELVPKWIRVDARAVLLKYSNSTTYCLPPSYFVGI